VQFLSALFNAPVLPDLTFVSPVKVPVDANMLGELGSQVPVPVKVGTWIELEKHRKSGYSILEPQDRTLNGVEESVSISMDDVETTVQIENPIGSLGGRVPASHTRVAIRRRQKCSSRKTLNILFPGNADLVSHPLVATPIASIAELQENALYSFLSVRLWTSHAGFSLGQDVCRRRRVISIGILSSCR